MHKKEMCYKNIILSSVFKHLDQTCLISKHENKTVIVNTNQKSFLQNSDTNLFIQSIQN